MNLKDLMNLPDLKIEAEMPTKLQVQIASPGLFATTETVSNRLRIRALARLLEKKGLIEKGEFDEEIRGLIEEQGADLKTKTTDRLVEYVKNRS